MKKSELIDKLQKSLNEEGDCHLLHVKIATLSHTDESFLLSPNRKNSKGAKLKMNIKEFIEFCKANPIASKE